jgi:hypothetical protein
MGSRGIATLKPLKATTGGGGVRRSRGEANGCDTPSFFLTFHDEIYIQCDRGESARTCE